MQARVLLWDLQAGGQNWVDNAIRGHFRAFDSFTGRISAVLFNKVAASDWGSSFLMAIVCADGTVRVVDMMDYDFTYSLSIAATADMMPSWTMSSSRSQIGHRILAAFSTCGCWLAIAGLSSSSEVQIFNAEDGTLATSFMKHLSAITVIRWAIDAGGKQALLIGNAAGHCNFQSWEPDVGKEEAMQSLPG